MSRDLHLIERMGHMNRIDKESATWESGWWAIAPETAEKLVGGRIFFHKAKDKPSFFGGKILSFRIETEGEWPGRIIFTFVFSPEFRGVKARREGWGMEKKIVYPPKPSNKFLSTLRPQKKRGLRGTTYASLLLPLSKALCLTGGDD